MAGDRLRLRVRLIPRGGRDRIDGFAPGADGERVLKVRVTAPPVDGAANAALVRLLAKALGVAKSAVTIIAGETSARRRSRSPAIQPRPPPGWRRYRPAGVGHVSLPPS